MGSPQGFLEEVVSLGERQVNHEASSPWTITRVVPELDGASDGNPQAARDAGLGGKVRTSWSLQALYDAVPFAQDLSAGSWLCQSRLMLGGLLKPKLPHPSSQFCPELTPSRGSFPPDPLM